MGILDNLKNLFTRAPKATVPTKLKPGLVIDDLPLFAQNYRHHGSMSQDDVTMAIRSADTGRMWPLVTLADTARRKSGHLQCILGTREMVLPSLPWQVSTTSTRRKDKKAAEWLNEALHAAWGGQENQSDLCGLRFLLSHLQSAVFHGYAVAETVYERSGGLLWIKGWNNVTADRIAFNQETGRACWYDENTSTTGYPGVDLHNGFPSGKVIVYQPRINGARPHQEGLSRVLLWLSLYGQWTVRDWVTLGELAWKPWRIGTYEAGIDEASVKTLETILRQLTSSGVAMLPARTDLRIEWPDGNQQTGGGHAAMLEFLNAEQSKAVLGQTLTTEAGSRGARSLGEVHELVRKDILEYDAKNVAECLRRYLFAPLIARNFGDDVMVPSLQFLTEETVDLVNFANGITTLASHGLRVPAAWVRDRAGIPEPQADEDCLGPNEVDIPISQDTGLPEDPTDKPT